MYAWDFHPALVHFPIALLITAFVLDLVARIRKREFMVRAAVWLYAAGVISAAAASVAGVIAWHSAPQTTNPSFMLGLHPILAGISCILFLRVAISRWNQQPAPATWPMLFLAALATASLIATGAVGHHLVARHGVGVKAEEIHEIRPIQDDFKPRVGPGA